jgi:HTH-type transcriptional regulator/antitoxin HigA
MKTLIKVIRTPADYDAAMARISNLIQGPLVAGSDEDEELEVLRVLVSSYEAKHDDPVPVSAVEAIRFRMDQQKLRAKDLVPYIGSVPRVSEVLAEKRPLTVTMMRRLAKGLGIPASALLQEAGDNADDDIQYDYKKFPVAEMSSRGYLSNVSLASLRADPEKHVAPFLRHGSMNVSSALLRAPMQQSGSRSMDQHALIVWLVRVTEKAKRITLPTKYKQGSITTDWMRELAKLSRFKKGPCLAQEFLLSHGIRLVFERHFPKTYLDGAAMLDGTDPIVALTLRHDRLDNFWFALLHEIVHVQKHLKSGQVFIADNLDDKTRTGETEEDEADAGAREALIPKELWDSAEVRTTFALEDALDLAQKAGVNPAIVAGRIRYETGDWRLLSGLIRDGGQVTSLFQDQLN